VRFEESSKVEEGVVGAFRRKGGVGGRWGRDDFLQTGDVDNKVSSMGTGDKVQNH